MDKIWNIEIFVNSLFPFVVVAIVIIAWHVAGELMQRDIDTTTNDKEIDAVLKKHKGRNNR